MMADDAEMDEEIERQLEADAHDRDYVEKPLFDEKELDVTIPALLLFLIARDFFSFLVFE